MNLNPFRFFGVIRLGKRIADALERANVLKQVELEAAGIAVPLPKGAKEPKPEEIEVMYSDPEEQELNELLEKLGRIPKEVEE